MQWRRRQREGGRRRSQAGLWRQKAPPVKTPESAACLQKLEWKLQSDLLLLCGSAGSDLREEPLMKVRHSSSSSLDQRTRAEAESFTADVRILVFTLFPRSVSVLHSSVCNVVFLLSCVDAAS